MIRQGQEQIIPARIKSTTGFSNDVINITLAGNNNNNNYDTAAGFSSSDLHVAIERNQPPLFKNSSSSTYFIGYLHNTFDRNNTRAVYSYTNKTNIH
jgi:hypothetical protein